jgi:hypothetical protein
VVPGLQSRGAYKTAYATGTLREKLFPGRGPFLYPTPPGAAAERARELVKIRTGMEKRHNETARSLGFASNEDCFTWDNPDFFAPVRNHMSSPRPKTAM